MAFGIVCEYNPFHNGHLRQINEIKSVSDEPIICVMSGNFTQRGELAIVDKYARAEMALLCGADLVVELPYLFATQAASIYAKGAIDILNYLNCNYLVFGSETNDVKLLQSLVEITYNNKEYEKCSSILKLT